MNMSLKTRFAPSPTGLMHFGNVRTALFNYLFAKRMGAVFLLRIEDTDVNRSEQPYRDAILSDLEWLGLQWEEGPYYQSERQAIYDNYYQILEEKGCVYPCFCTEEQLAMMRKVQLASHQPPRYPGTCRQLTTEEIQAKKALGLPFTLRFEVSHEKIVQFTDLIKGPQHFETAHMGDFIIRRGDKSASFMFCNAIDDALMGITHTLRGDDHLTNTPRQMLILKALDLPIPQYGHFPTILGPDSRPLSKRNGSRSIQELREEGYLSLAILNYLARLGHSDPDRHLLEVNILSDHFDLTHISHSPAHYDPNQLNFWQKEAMHHSTWQVYWTLIAPYVDTWVPLLQREAFVEAIKPNVVMPGEALTWAKIIFGEISLEASTVEVKEAIRMGGADFFRTILTIIDTLPTFSYTHLISELQQKTGRKGKAIFFPLRAALTTALHGPELEKLFILMGMEKLRTRLMQAAQYATNL